MPNHQQKERARHVTVGCLSGGARARWRMGEWTCTDRNLVFRQAGRVVLQIPLDDVIAIGEEERPFAFGRSCALAVTYRTSDDTPAKVWAMGRGLADCVRAVGAMKLQPVTEADIVRVVCELKPLSEQIVWHLWENLHSDIHELARVLNCSDHSKILRMIREEVNESARNLLGYPLLAFEHRRADPMSGKDVLFSWWIAGSRYRDIIVDDYCETFDEGGFYRLVAELRGIPKDDIAVSIEETAVVFRKKNDGLRVIHEIDLPNDADGSFEIKGVRNGMMELTLPKKCGKGSGV